MKLCFAQQTWNLELQNIIFFTKKYVKYSFWIFPRTKKCCFYNAVCFFQHIIHPVIATIQFIWVWGRGLFYKPATPLLSLISKQAKHCRFKNWLIVLLNQRNEKTIQQGRQEWFLPKSEQPSHSYQNRQNIAGLKTDW